MPVINDQRLIEHFLEIIQIDSESGKEKVFADILSAQLEDLGFEVHKLPVPESVSNGYNIYARLEGSLAGSTVFSCHMDTVSPGNGIQPVIEDGIIRTPLDPFITFSDDPLRMLRAIRFATQLNFFIEEKTFEGITGKTNTYRLSFNNILKGFLSR